jgi:hypothetical protein
MAHAGGLERVRAKGGYLVNLDRQMLEWAPTYGMDEDFRWTPDYVRQVDK